MLLAMGFKKSSSPVIQWYLDITINACKHDILICKVVLRLTGNQKVTTALQNCPFAILSNVHLVYLMTR